MMLAFSLAGVLQSLINVCKKLEGPSIETTMKLQKITVRENASKIYWERKGV